MRRFVSLKIQQLVHLLRNGKPQKTTTKNKNKEDAFKFHE
jgi:hypothetical protein